MKLVYCRPFFEESCVDASKGLQQGETRLEKAMVVVVVWVVYGSMLCSTLFTYDNSHFLGINGIGSARIKFMMAKSLCYDNK